MMRAHGMNGIIRLTSASALPGFHSPGAGFEKPFDMLAACHERVDRMLALLVKLQHHLSRTGCDEPARQAARDVMRYFDQAAPLHHQDEELHVFPPLLAGPDPELRSAVERLLQDHRDMEGAWVIARAVLHEVAHRSEATQPQAAGALPVDAELALTRFAALYHSHLQTEDQLVYPAARLALFPADLHTMSADMMRRRGLTP